MNNYNDWIDREADGLRDERRDEMRERFSEPLSLADVLGRMSEFPLPARESLFVTRNGMEQLRKFAPARTAWTNPVPLDAIDIHVVPELKKRVPKSLDRFAEYDERDMEWAVPAGLAKWVEVDVDAMMMRVRDTIEQKFLMGLTPIECGAHDGTCVDSSLFTSIENRPKDGGDRGA